MVGGTRNISRRVLHFIAKNHPDVNVQWLMTGNGEMFLEKKEDAAHPPVGVNEPDRAAYERKVRVGVLEEALSRLAALEDRVGEMEERLRGLEDGNNG